MLSPVLLAPSAPGGSDSVCVSQVGFRKGGVDILGRRTQLEVLLSVLLLAALLALLACLLVLGLGFSSGNNMNTFLCLSFPTPTSLLSFLPFPFLLLLSFPAPPFLPCLSLLYCLFPFCSFPALTHPSSPPPLPFYLGHFSASCFLSFLVFSFSCHIPSLPSSLASHFFPFLPPPIPYSSAASSLSFPASSLPYLLLSSLVYPYFYLSHDAVQTVGVACACPRRASRWRVRWWRRWTAALTRVRTSTSSPAEAG